MKTIKEYIEMVQSTAPSDAIQKIAAITKLSSKGEKILREQLAYIVDKCAEAVADVLGNNAPEVLREFFENAEDDGRDDEIEEVNEHIREYVIKNL
jgi:DNA-binding ferritin-like protein